MTLSGCFYLSMPTGSGAMVFHDPRPATLHSRRWGSGANRSERLLLTPSEGVLLIFPAWLEHSVEPNLSSRPRVSVAMNATLPRGTFARRGGA